MFNHQKIGLTLAMLFIMSPNASFSQNNIEGSMQNRDSTTSIRAASSSK